MAQAHLMPRLGDWLSRGNYQSRIKGLFGANLIAYLPLGELAGGTVYDKTANACNGVTGGSVGPTMGQPGVEPGGMCPSFGGANAYINWYSAALAGKVDFTEGSLFVFVTCNAWSGTDDEFVNFGADTNNKITYGRTGTNKLFYYYKAGAVSKYKAYLTTTSTWLHYGLSWSKSNDRCRFYLNGALYAELNTLGNWAGALSASIAVLGALNLTPTEVWNGKLAHVVLLNREATALETWKIVNLAIPTCTRTTIIGDSISAWGVTVRGHVEQIRDGYNGGLTSVVNHAVSGNSIMTHLAGQVTAAASDDCSLGIIHMGTNDDDAGNMATLQAEVEEQIIALRASNPRMTLYYMNVLPRWTDVGGGTEVSKENIRHAIAAACTAQSVTCWDTYHTSWITSADTSDGLHPNQTGANKIYTQIAGLLPAGL